MFEGFRSQIMGVQFLVDIWELFTLETSAILFIEKTFFCFYGRNLIEAVGILWKYAVGLLFLAVLLETFFGVFLLVLEIF